MTAAEENVFGSQLVRANVLERSMEDTSPPTDLDMQAELPRLIESLKIIATSDVVPVDVRRAALELQQKLQGSVAIESTENDNKSVIGRS